MDWLLARQDTIQKKLASRHLGKGSMVLYDLSSSYFEGATCPLAQRGCSRLHCSAGRAANIAGVQTRSLFSVAGGCRTEEQFVGSHPALRCREALQLALHIVPGGLLCGRRQCLQHVDDG